MALGAIWRLCRELRPELLLLYAIKPVVWGSLAARLAGTPRRFSLIDGLGYAFGDSNERGRRLLRALAIRLYRLALPLSERVFFLNPDDRELFLAEGAVRRTEQAILLNGSGVDLRQFSQVPLPPAPTFVMISRLLGEKGVREYVVAARELRRRHPHARCRLVGWIDATPDAIASSELEAWVRDGDIEHLGRLDDVRPAIASSSVVVLPSVYREGVPQSLLEGMAMGRGDHHHRSTRLSRSRAARRERPARHGARPDGSGRRHGQPGRKARRCFQDGCRKSPNGHRAVRRRNSQRSNSRCLEPLGGTRRSGSGQSRFPSGEVSVDSVEQRGQFHRGRRALARIDEVSRPIVEAILQGHECQMLAKPAHLAGRMVEHQIVRHIVWPTERYEQVGAAIVDIEEGFARLPTTA